ncbi:MAG TPA: hypothetical protein VG269_28365 [Tepidisphaeraceae bacterium]|jgi:hypothetical protein|nr:hypothetical protein [Tepidisphaeraceae bacterium]
MSAVLLAAALAAVVGLALRGWSRRTSSGAPTQATAAPRAPRAAGAAARAIPRSPLPATAKGPNFDSYKILLDRSMFSISRATPAAASASAAAAPAPADAVLSLKGISQDDARFTAFVEDPAAGRIRELKVGDALARGRVSAITLTGVEYVADGKTVRVAVGQSLGEGVAVVAAADDAGPGRVASSADEQRTVIANTH